MTRHRATNAPPALREFLDGADHVVRGGRNDGFGCANSLTRARHWGLASRAMTLARMAAASCRASAFMPPSNLKRRRFPTCKRACEPVSCSGRRRLFANRDTCGPEIGDCRLQPGSAMLPESSLDFLSFTKSSDATKAMGCIAPSNPVGGQTENFIDGTTPRLRPSCRRKGHGPGRESFAEPLVCRYQFHIQVFGKCDVLAVIG